MLLGLCGIILLLLELLICLIGWGAKDIILVLIVNSYGFVNFLTVVSYIGIFIGIIGIPIFFLGLYYMGIGQIAVNTDKEDVEENIKVDNSEIVEDTNENNI